MSEQEKSVTVEDNRLVIGDEIEIRVWLHDPEGEPTPIANGEEIQIEHPADGLIDGMPCGIYSPEGRPDDRPKVTVQVEGHDDEE